MRGAAPLISDLSRPWWDALARREIVMQRCEACAGWVFYPRSFCPTCGARRLLWTAIEPSATLYTFTVAHAPLSPVFSHLDKPILAIAEFRNGAKVATSLVTADRTSLRIGMPLVPVFDSETYPSVTLLRFRPAP